MDKMGNLISTKGSGYQPLIDEKGSKRNEKELSRKNIKNVETVTSKKERNVLSKLSNMVSNMVKSKPEHQTEEGRSTFSSAMNDIRS